MIRKVLLGIGLLAVSFGLLTAAPQPAQAQLESCLPGFCGGAGGPRPCNQFTIPSATNLVAWIDACDINNFVISSGSVQTANDLSSNHYVFSSGAIGPQYLATGLNSRPTLGFSASSTLISLNYPTAAFGTGNELTFFAAATLAMDTGGGFHTNGPLINYTGNGATSAYNNVGSFGILSLGTTNNLTYLRNGATLGTTVTYGVPVRLIFTLKSDGTRTLYINGVVVASGAGIVANFVSPGYISMGGSQFDTGFFSGNYAGTVSEWGLYNVYYDATQVAAQDTYLKNKWGF